MKNRQAGFSLLSMVVAMGIAGIVMVIALKVICFLARDLRNALDRMDRDLELVRGGDFVAAVSSWVSVGLPGKTFLVSDEGHLIGFSFRPGLDGSVTEVDFTISQERLAYRKNGGNFWTVVEKLPDEVFTLQPSSAVRVPLGNGLDIVLPPPLIEFKNQLWGTP